jgi:hypothetical protein
MARGEAYFVTDRASAPHVAAVLTLVALGHLSLIPNVADLDGFYHVGHALAYLHGSPLDTSLPWATQSVIGDLGGDLWWGFHILLTPFVAAGSVPLALLAAGVTLTAALGLSTMRILQRHGLPLAGLWAALSLVAVPNVFFRFLMVRPHMISMTASIALLSVLVRGRWWHVLMLSALISWVHLSLFWVAPAVTVAYALARIPVTVALGRTTPDTGVAIRHALPASFAGIVLGWLLRPNPWAATALLNVQLLQLFAAKSAGQPLTFAAELNPIGSGELMRTAWFFLIAWAASVVVTLRSMWRGRFATLGQANGTLVAAALLLSAAFLALAVLSARRALEQWVAFGIMVVPFAWSLLGRSPEAALPQGPGPSWGAALVNRLRAMGPLRFVLAALLAGHLAWGIHRHQQNVQLVARPATTLRAVATHLEENSAPGDIVFHARWDNFGPLFAFNRSNRYLGGMDPIFQFAHDPQSYWEFFYLSSDLNTSWTCDAYPCTAGVATDTHEALTQHFGARWVVVQPTRNPRFTLYLLNDDRYALELETQSEALFRVLDR